MSSSKKLIGHGSLYVVATVAPILTLLAVTPLVTRALGAENYGQVAIAITVYQFSSVLLSLGLPSAITRNAILERGGFGGASGLVYSGAIIAIGAGILAALSAPFWTPSAFPGVDPLVVPLSIAAGVGHAIVTMAQALFRADERVTTFVTLSITTALLPPAIGLTLATVVRDAGATGYVLGLVAGFAVSAFASLFLVWRHTRPEVSLAALRHGIRIGLPTLPHAAAVPLLLSVMLSFVTASDGLATAGRLQVAVVLGTAIITVLNAVNNAWAPMVFKHDESSRGQFLKSSTLLVACVALALTCGFTIVAPWVVPFIGGPLVTSFAPVQASILVAASGAFHVLYLANIHMTFIAGRTGPLALSTPLAAALSIALALFLSQTVAKETALLTYAAVWPTFYAIQAAFSYWLARWSGHAPAKIGWSFVPLGLALGMCAQGIFVGLQPIAGVVTAALALALSGAIVAISSRRGTAA